MFDWVSRYTIENAAVALLGAVAILLLFRARRSEYWRSAWRQVRANALAMICLLVICCYVAVGLLDSIAWRDVRKSRDGESLKDREGNVVYEERGLSILDRLADAVCESLRKDPERTYSAPLADRQLTTENVEAPDGTIVRANPGLKHAGHHILGTDKGGGDVYYRAMKGIRTALIIGCLTTLIAIPFAILFGVLAGYFGKWVDDAVQYVYTTLASIPHILLMVALMMLMGRGLPQMCLVMGITGWTGLCRLLRAETLKLREMEYVQAAKALGVGHFTIILRHIVPNLMHIILITFILQFSGLVMSEAVLSYIGVGVGAETGSWGLMINESRFDLSREPVVWWNFAASLIFMFGLILPVNLFGDAMRDALDPRLRTR